MKNDIGYKDEAMVWRGEAMRFDVRLPGIDKVLTGDQLIRLRNKITLAIICALPDGEINSASRKNYEATSMLARCIIYQSYEKKGGKE